MSKLEFCKALLARFNGTWPVKGGLAMAASLYDNKKTVDAAEGEMRAKVARARKLK